VAETESWREIVNGGEIINAMAKLFINTIMSKLMASAISRRKCRNG
jgi:hypothetical protein